MDQAALVTDQIKDGESLLEQLVRDGFDVGIAFWLKSSEDEHWFLYIASDVVDQKGVQRAYREIHKSITALSPSSVDPFEIKLVGLNDPIVSDIRKLRNPNTPRIPMRIRGIRLGGERIDEVYVYPATN
ncbi:MAG: hypothetical protein L0Y72_29830 [Gemmataceae bacterium]|nr:hypothetical protein [Gemmataceae bacterium]MCI0743248.1 hypothetical protein [Gemmataceae bacterium]